MANPVEKSYWPIMWDCHSSQWKFSVFTGQTTLTLGQSNISTNLSLTAV